MFCQRQNRVVITINNKVLFYYYNIIKNYVVIKNAIKCYTKNNSSCLWALSKSGRMHRHTMLFNELLLFFFAEFMRCT